MPALEPVVCLVSAPPADAARIAAALVERELAACVNVLPGARSIYRWQGEIHADEEALLVLKSTRAALAGIDRALQEIHPYDTFELVALEVTAGSEPYLEWLTASVAPQPSSR